MPPGLALILGGMVLLHQGGALGNVFRVAALLPHEWTGKQQGPRQLCG